MIGGSSCSYFISFDASYRFVRWHTGRSSLKRRDFLYASGFYRKTGAPERFHWHKWLEMIKSLRLFSVWLLWEKVSSSWLYYPHNWNVHITRLKYGIRHNDISWCYRKRCFPSKTKCSFLSFMSKLLYSCVIVIMLLDCKLYPSNRRNNRHLLIGMYLTNYPFI